MGLARYNSEECKTDSNKYTKRLKMFLVDSARDSTLEGRERQAFVLTSIMEDWISLIGVVINNTENFNHNAKMLFFITFVYNIRSLYKTDSMNGLNWN